MSITPTGDRSGALAALGIQAGSQAGEEVPIRLPVVNIGRGRQNDVVLDDDSVSSTHARLEYADAQWRITDLGSANGTYVEGVRLAAQVPTPLPYGSAVRLGGARLHFRGVEGADPDAARVAYTPPTREATIRERRAGLRIPIWLVALLVVLLAVAALLSYGWLMVGPAPPPAVPPLESPGAPPASPGAPSVSPGMPPASPGAPPVLPGAPPESPGAPPAPPPGEPAEAPPAS